MSTASSSFSPVWWLAGPHLQTVWGRLSRPRDAVRLARERLVAPDGELLHLDSLEGKRGTPRVLLLHGLEGSSRSVYIQGLLLKIRARGWRATVLNFRSCAWEGAPSRPVPVRRARLYQSGDTDDLAHVVSILAARETDTPLFAIGVSLGGNVLLKWLAEEAGRFRITRACVISVPYDLAEGARHMEDGLGPLYVRIFLRSLRRKVQDVVRRFPEARGRIDLRRVLKATTFREFDDAATAPLHGFVDAADYYTRSSSLGLLSRIAVPTLCLSSADDPFLPRAVLGRAVEAASPSMRLVVTARGGHVGFVGPSARGLRYWAEHEALGWLEGASRCDTRGEVPA